MARRAPPSQEPDLFSAVPGMAPPPVTEAASAPRRRRGPAAAPVIEALPPPQPTPPPPTPPEPTPLDPDAVGREMTLWDDAAVERLHDLVVVERLARGLVRAAPKPDRPVPGAIRQRQPEILAKGLAPGQVSAIVEADRAGVHPGRIAREFGLPLAAVQRTIAASDA